MTCNARDAETSALRSVGVFFTIPTWDIPSRLRVSLPVKPCLDFLSNQVHQAALISNGKITYNDCKISAMLFYYHHSINHVSHMKINLSRVPLITLTSRVVACHVMMPAILQVCLPCCLRGANIVCFWPMVRDKKCAAWALELYCSGSWDARHRTSPSPSFNYVSVNSS